MIHGLVANSRVDCLQFQLRVADSRSTFNHLCRKAFKSPPVHCTSPQYKVANSRKANMDNFRDLLRQTFW